MSTLRQRIFHQSSQSNTSSDDAAEKIQTDEDAAGAFQSPQLAATLSAMMHRQQAAVAAWVNELADGGSGSLPTTCDMIQTSESVGGTKFGTTEGLLSVKAFSQSDGEETTAEQATLPELLERSAEAARFAQMQLLSAERLRGEGGTIPRGAGGARIPERLACDLAAGEPEHARCFSQEMSIRVEPESRMVTNAKQCFAVHEQLVRDGVDGEPERASCFPQDMSFRVEPELPTSPNAKQCFDVQEQFVRDGVAGKIVVAATTNAASDLGFSPHRRRRTASPTGAPSIVSPALMSSSPGSPPNVSSPMASSPSRLRSGIPRQPSRFNPLPSQASALSSFEGVIGDSRGAGNFPAMMDMDGPPLSRDPGCSSGATATPGNAAVGSAGVPPGTSFRHHFGTFSGSSGSSRRFVHQSGLLESSLPGGFPVGTEALTSVPSGSGLSSRSGSGDQTHLEEFLRGMIGPSSNWGEGPGTSADGSFHAHSTLGSGAAGGDAMVAAGFVRNGRVGREQCFSVDVAAGSPAGTESQSPAGSPHHAAASRLVAGSPTFSGSPVVPSAGLSSSMPMLSGSGMAAAKLGTDTRRTLSLPGGISAPESVFKQEYLTQRLLRVGPGGAFTSVMVGGADSVGSDAAGITGFCGSDGGVSAVAISNSGFIMADDLQSPRLNQEYLQRDSMAAGPQEWRPRTRTRLDAEAMERGIIKPRSMRERKRRDKISEGLQQLRLTLPAGAVGPQVDTAAMVEAAVSHITTLQSQISNIENVLLVQSIRDQRGNKHQTTSS